MKKQHHRNGEFHHKHSLGQNFIEDEALLEQLAELSLVTEEDCVLRPIEEDVDRELLRRAIAMLSEREQEIIVLRFGLGGREEQTQKEVADLLGISQSYISRLEKKIMLRLRREIQRIQ